MVNSPTQCPRTSFRKETRGEAESYPSLFEYYVERLCSQYNATYTVSKSTIISACDCAISFSSPARNLGFYIKDDMSVELHTKNICRSAYSELRRVSTIRHLLSVDSTKTLVSAFVLSRLDHCNSLLSGCPRHPLEKLQKVKNSAARLVLKVHKRDHVSPLLRTLHWLPIQARIEHKLSTLCHSFFSDTAPVYRSDLLRVYSPSRQLRSSSDSRTLNIPHIKTKTSGHRSFSRAAPAVWNSLPREISQIQSITAFKTALTTHLSKSYLY